MKDTFRCGHLKTPDNSITSYNVVANGDKHYYMKCRTCINSKKARWNAAAVRVPENVNSYARGRKNCPKHTGAAEEVRAALKRVGKPLSIYSLHIATGLKPKQVKRAVSGMLFRGGGLVQEQGVNGVMYYRLYEAPAPAVTPTPASGEEFKWPTRPTYPQYRWGSTRLG
jgi:hypothetical protein